MLIPGLQGCAIPGGASVDAANTGRYQVELPYKQVDFTVATPQQSLAGVTATVAVQELHPTLYYGYSVSSQVNGGYVLMPDPPRVYTVRKVPFYRYDSDSIVVRLDLKNDTQDVVRANQAACSFDLDGKTVATIPLDMADLLPGHSLEVEVKGPSVDSFGTKPNGTLTVWLYGLTADKNQTVHWQADYTMVQQIRMAWGMVVGTTNTPAQANQYKDEVDPAGPDALVTPPGN